MIGLLKEKNEIEKLQQEYKKLAETAFKVDTNSTIETPEEELTRRMRGINQIKFYVIQNYFHIKGILKTEFFFFFCNQ
jgi:hypothetical protein